MTSATQEPEMTLPTETNAAPAPTGNLEITVSRAELLRELTAAQSRGRAQDDDSDPVELPV